jgi:ketosteroid isomerase-like protein
MPDSSTSPIAVAERLFAAIMAGDIEAARACYADDVVIWHNNDGLTQTRDENLRTLRWVVKNVAGLRYEEVRRQATDTGFIQQHVLRGTAPSGKALEVPACIVCTVVDGKITRLDEYLDSAHTAVLGG